MATTFQDDGRENEAISLFALDKDDAENRQGIDAFLSLDGQQIPFELKSSSKDNVTTVRDFGPDHVSKWKNKHWLFGFYKSKKLSYFLYGSPSMMSKWIEDKWNYVKPDFDFSELIADSVTIEHLHKILKKKTKYTLGDAISLQKKQLVKQEYLDLMDMDNGYSANCMLNLLKQRATYLMSRGSTLNNPHIPKCYFEGWEKITDNHAARLRAMVNDYFNER